MPLSRGPWALRTNHSALGLGTHSPVEADADSRVGNSGASVKGQPASRLTAREATCAVRWAGPQLDGCFRSWRVISRGCYGHPQGLWPHKDSHCGVAAKVHPGLCLKLESAENIP